MVEWWGHTALSPLLASLRASLRMPLQGQGTVELPVQYRMPPLSALAALGATVPGAGGTVALCSVPSQWYAGQDFMLVAAKPPSRISF